ncbi:MAG: PadR family transcriptional regulator [Armatimonadetes bacterium]|nr:PadR family transcriptional regulator [Armatimonadota bacterium]
MAKRKQLSTIEQTVLGIVWLIGPCTTYGVMRELKSSSSTYYRNRAGTTYPTVERLVKGGLLDYCEEGVGARKERRLVITSAGVSQLTEWLKPPTPEAEIRFSRDLLRLRINFLGALPRELRQPFLTSARATLESFLQECEAVVAGDGEDADPFVLLANRGVIHETRARIAWLDEITPIILSLP